MLAGGLSCLMFGLGKVGGAQGWAFGFGKVEGRTFCLLGLGRVDGAVFSLVLGPDSEGMATMSHIRFRLRRRCSSRSSRCMCTRRGHVNIPGGIQIFHIVIFLPHPQ